jgi:hypothetical protein
MKNYKVIVAVLLISSAVVAQHSMNTYEYEPNEEYPYGRINPEAPEELADFGPMIGKCHCKSISRIDQNSWADTVDMTWIFKYIMNGMAVQDETLKADGKHSGSIRQFIADSAQWYVHYYSSAGPTTTLSTWEGSKSDDGNIILYRDNTAPNGTPGWYRLTFSEVSDKGFDWVGEWVNKTETFLYPTWKIHCTKMRR